MGCPVFCAFYDLQEVSDQDKRVYAVDTCTPIIYMFSVQFAVSSQFVNCELVEDSV